MRGNSHVQFLGGPSSERMGGYPTAASGLRDRAARCIACRHKLLADTQSGVLPWPDGHKLTRLRPNLPLSDAFSLDCLFRVAT